MFLGSLLLAMALLLFGMSAVLGLLTFGAALSRTDGIRLEWSESHGHVPATQPMRLSIRGVERPVFAYGWLMDFSFWPFALGDGTQLSFDPAATPLQNLHRFVLYNIATSMGWNLGRALTNAVLIVLVGPALLRLLRRSARPAEFTPGFEPSQQGPERTE